MTRRYKSYTRKTIYVSTILTGIFLNHPWLIPNILKWRNCKIFTKLVPSQTPSRSSHRRCSVKKKTFLKIYKISRENTCAGVCFKLYLKETPTQVLSSEICEVFMNTYFEEYHRTTVSALPRIYKKLTLTSSSGFREDIAFCIIT